MGQDKELELCLREPQVQVDVKSNWDFKDRTLQCLRGGCVETLRVGLLVCEMAVMAVQGTCGNRSGISTRGLKHHVSCLHTLPALTSLGCEAPEQGKVKKQILLGRLGGSGG